MHVSDVIAQLAGIRAEHGNIEVKRWNHCMSYGDDHEVVETVEVFSWKDDPPYVSVS
ncbi:hypothetical protein MycrhDRAFT_5790 [Mycolicibacterium rhodesiae JS60]|nr:hypothetical protein MycrhDRAFT_5790 [Mycolicibacterium rhodesiae JS60]